MIIKYTGIRTVFFVSFFLISQSSYSANLKDAIDTAQANNRNIKLERIRLKSIETEKDKAVAEFLPNVSANVTYGQRNSFYQGQTYDRSTKQRTQELKVEQPIFDGMHSVSKYREANYKVRSGVAKTSDKIQEISFSAIESYCNLFRYQELLKLQSDNKKLGKRFKKLVGRRKYKKLIDNSDIIKFNYEISLTEEKYIDTLTKLNKAKFDYRNVVGELHENLIEPTFLQESFDTNQVLESALTNNHSIRSQHYKYLAAKASYNAEKSSFLPKVSLDASLSKQDKVVYLNNQDLNSRSVFLNVSIPIFQKGVEYANMDKARYDRSIALEEYKIAQESITREVSQAIEEYNFFLEINKTNQKLLKLAQKRVNILRKRLKSKVEDPIEFIRARIEANDRNINYIESQMNLIISFYKIKYFLGEI